MCIIGSMKMVATILEGIKAQFPRTNLRAIEEVVNEVFAEEANTADRYDLAEDWGCNVPELDLLRQWFQWTGEEHYDDIWAEVGH